MTPLQLQLRVFVRGAYDLQKVRIGISNRLSANFRAKMGLESEVEGEEPSEEDVVIVDTIKRRFKLLTANPKIEDKIEAIKAAALAGDDEGIIDTIKSWPKDSWKKDFHGDEIISSVTEAALVGQYILLEALEIGHFKQLKGILEEFPIWTDWMEEVRGVGPALAAILISEIDIHKATYPSSLWRYAGLDVAPDGEGRSRRKNHLITRPYITKEGEEAEKLSITFNPFLKTKLLGVLGSSFLRMGGNPYATIYGNYKHRLENHVEHKLKTKGHRHAMATRYMVKMFLVDLYREWRALEGLIVHAPYSEGKLGMAPHHEGSTSSTWTLTSITRARTPKPVVQPGSDGIGGGGRGTPGYGGGGGGLAPIALPGHGAGGNGRSTPSVQPEETAPVTTDILLPRNPVLAARLREIERMGKNRA